MISRLVAQLLLGSKPSDTVIVLLLFKAPLAESKEADNDLGEVPGAAL
jgi:hypothetical protein